MKINRQHILILASILLVGFIIRWGVLDYICGPPVASYPTMDEMNFRELAGNILDYRTFAGWTEGFYTVSTRAPIYPLMIASAYSISGNRSYAVPKILNLIFDMCNILLLFLLARGIFNIRIGIFAAGIYAVFGHASYFMAISSPHTFAVTLLLLVAIALISIKRSYYLAVPALAILYTLLIHTRPVFLVALPFLFPAIWLQISSMKQKSRGNDRKSSWFKEKLSWISSDRKVKCLRSLIPIILVLLLCLPWGIRNYRKHKTIVPVSIIAGWHIASNINYDMKLSIQYLTDQLYAPECRTFKEADYFQLAKAKMFDAFFSNPVKFSVFGFARLVYGWTPPGPCYRFLLPRAYVFPVKIYGGYILPLPDFEGFIYFFIASTILASILLKKKIIELFAYVFYRIRGVFVILMGYSLVHIIGIPLIAYRFLIEPFLIVIFLGFIFCYATELLKKYRNPLTHPDKTKAYAVALRLLRLHKLAPSEELSVRTNIITLYVAVLLLFSAMMIPFFQNPAPTDYTYFAFIKAKEVLSYEQLREMQWSNLGNIKAGTHVTVQGVVRYLHRGFKYVEDDYYAKKDSAFTAARLFVRYGDKNNQLGTGDVRLNIRSSDIPENGDVIKITGTAKTGPFKEIIIDINSN